VPTIQVIWRSIASSRLRGSSTNRVQEQALPTRPESGHAPLMGEPWSDRWRNSIRAGETAVVIGLWGGGIAASDMVIAAILLGAGVVVGLIAILADPVQSRAAKAIACIVIIALGAASEAVVYWRHSILPKPLIAERWAGLTADEVSRLVREGMQAQPRTVPDVRVIVREAPAAGIPQPVAPVPERKLMGQDELRAALGVSTTKGAAYRTCFDNSLAVSEGLRHRTDRAVVAMNAYANGGKDKVIAQAYDDWASDVRAYLAQHKDILGDTSEFETARDKWPSTMLLFHNTGSQAWNRFNSHMDALNKINTRFVGRIDCTKSLEDAPAA
jgi:hypothetical protein